MLSFVLKKSTMTRERKISRKAIDMVEEKMNHGDGKAEAGTTAHRAPVVRFIRTLQKSSPAL
jgi:hypothetical protein